VLQVLQVQLVQLGRKVQLDLLAQLVLQEQLVLVAMRYQSF
jgi:hypothetical protein